MIGIQIDKDHATILDHGRTSCAGNTIPDPAIMRASNRKFDQFEKDRMNMSRRLFQSTGYGMSTMQPLSPGTRNKGMGMGLT